MWLKCLGSSSQGNCYVLKASNNDKLIIEAGLKFKDIKSGLDFDLSQIAGCIVSHEHKDHSKSIADMLCAGIRVYALESVLQGTHHPYAKIIQPAHGYNINGFRVFVFSVFHDVPCAGFIITHDEMGKLLFLTDTMMCEYKFDGINHFMIEANYDDATLDYNIEHGYQPSSMRDRLLHSHMELQTTIGILKSNDLSQAHEVILLHLSSRNSRKEYFAKSVQNAVGLPCYIAQKNFEIELLKNQ